jgi:hypothetical protein
MTTTTLIVLYVLVGVGLGGWMYAKSDRSPRAVLAAFALFCLWPLWAPFVLSDDR